DTNGVRKQAQATIENGENLNPFISKEFSKENFIELMKELNHTSQKGMVEMFDNNVGRSTVLNAFGGKTQSTPEDVSVQKFPTDGFTNSVSMASFGYNPILSRWSPYHGAYFAVMESVAKIVAAGGNYSEIRLTFQEYFEKLRDEAERWGKPFAALLGSVEAQKQLEIPAIGGKDSMSGSFQDIDVPPTLISFAVAPNHSSKIKSSTFQKTNSKISVFIPDLKENFLLDEFNLKQIFECIHQNNALIHSAMTVKSGGIAETLALMSFGNEVGFEINSKLDLMKFYPAAIIIEHSDELNIPSEIQSNYHLLGNTNSSNELKINEIKISIEEIKTAWKSTFAELFPEKSSKFQVSSSKLYNEENFASQNLNLKPETWNLKQKTTQPRVFIPAFPGTNSEYDSAKAFRKEGAETEIIVFKNLSEQDIEDTVSAYSKAIDNAQILFFPGGFSAADEPDGSGKFIAAVLRNERIKESVHRLLERNGLILGICNGFQGLIKSGLLPYGE